MPRAALACLSWFVLAAACKSPTQEDPVTSTPPPAAASTSPTSASTAPQPEPPARLAPEDALPAGSADYSAALVDAGQYKRGAIDFAELQRRVIARGLPPHPLGDDYLMMPVPAPPPGEPWDPKLMPDDWKGTFGEIAMTHFAGKITREEYDRLHAAAHPRCPK